MTKKIIIMGKGPLFIGKSLKNSSMIAHFEKESELLEFLKDVYPRTYERIKFEIFNSMVGCNSSIVCETLVRSRHLLRSKMNTSTEIILDSKDFNIIDSFMKSYDIPEGFGLSLLLYFIINYYKTEVGKR